MILGNRLTLKIFPYFIASVEPANLQGLLDCIYLSELKKLPRDKEYILLDIKTYTELYDKITAFLEKFLIAKFKSLDKIDKEDIIMEGTRIY